MPTSETRTHASMTMPLSRTRSRTSIRLVPPAARSTAMLCSCASGYIQLTAPAAAGLRGRFGARQLVNAFAQLANFGAQLVLRGACGGARRQVPIVAPPVKPDLLGLVERADEKANADGEQLDFR